MLKYLDSILQEVCIGLNHVVSRLIFQTQELYTPLVEVNQHDLKDQDFKFKPIKNQNFELVSDFHECRNSSQ